MVEPAGDAPVCTAEGTLRLFRIPCIPPQASVSLKAGNTALIVHILIVYLSVPWYLIVVLIVLICIAVRHTLNYSTCRRTVTG